ncbi:MAG: hypothetical protein ACTSSP_00910 [Candidatus Asgardarchaeia archaeon]
MKFTLAEIRAIGKNMSKLITLELPVKTSYRLSRLMSACSKELVMIEKSRTDLVKKYGVGNDKDGYKVKDEEEEKFRAEYSQFLMEEVEIDFEPIPIGDLDGFNISPIELSRLDKIIKEK